ncbi:transposase [Chryseobacterium oncorhynchi]|nr:transposase [Chryseobacterium oncorhynchi]
MMNYKNIHIGNIIQKTVVESGIESDRICNFFKCTEEEIKKMYLDANLSTDILLKWCKLLEVDFFRMYCQHLILYAPVSPKFKKQKVNVSQFRKNLYTKEMIDFILEQVNTREKTRQQIVVEYRIPKSTLYKWMSKYNVSSELDE